MNNINAIPFIRQLAERAARFLKRDMLEIESLQNSSQGAMKYAKTTYEKFSNFIIDECFNFDRAFGIYIKDIHSIRGIKKVEKPYFNWHINPISNLYNFAHTNNNFAMSVALTDSRKEVLVAMIYLPAIDTLYYAERGKGCYRVDFTGNTMKAKVGRRTLNEVIITALPRSYLKEFHSVMDERQSKVEISGCMLNDIANLASGKIDFVIAKNEPKVSCYAAKLIISEARGVFKGEAVSHSEDHLNILAGNGVLADSIDFR